jgi:hypothetical protein
MRLGYEGFMHCALLYVLFLELCVKWSCAAPVVTWFGLTGFEFAQVM